MTAQWDEREWKITKIASPMKITETFDEEKNKKDYKFSRLKQSQAIQIPETSVVAQNETFQSIYFRSVPFQVNPR